jgi:hypothetical protein
MMLRQILGLTLHLLKIEVTLMMLMMSVEVVGKPLLDLNLLVRIVGLD